MLVYDPVIKRGTFQLTFRGKTKVYRNGDPVLSRIKFANVLKYNGTPEEFKEECVTIQLTPALRKSGEEIWCSPEYL